MIKPRAWQDRESKKKRTKNAVNAYVSQIVEGKKIDWQQIGNIYRADQKKPEATVKRLFREKVITNMVEEKLKEILSSRGIDKGYVLDTILKAISIAEDKQDVSNMLRGVENFVDMLEMKPSKKVTTDTLQIDMTNQIMDNIETEEKKLVASRKVESDVVEYHDPGDEND
jgi:DNA-binding IscR family transcriptional regulator